MNSLERTRCALRACLIALLVGSSFAQAATVLWDSTPNPADVIDMNLIIDGDVQLKLGANSIQANTADVNVTIMSPSTVRGNDTGASQLYITAAAGLNVNFNINASNDLSFIGSLDGNNTPLLIVVSGLGSVNFFMGGGRTVTFGNIVGSGGTEVYVLMNPQNGPTLFFQRQDTLATENLNTVVRVGEQNSLLGYLSTTPISNQPDDIAVIRFDPANPLPNNGRMMLDIRDTGGVIITGVYTDNGNPLGITLGNIDRTTSAGLFADFQIVNGSTGGGQVGTDPALLLVTNRNETLPDLLIDPFTNFGAASDNVNYKGTFTGNRRGFVLGNNALMVINNSAGLDYVGLTNNECPQVTVSNCDLIETPAVKSRNASAFFIDGSYNPLAVTPTIFVNFNSAMYFRSGIDSTGNIVDMGIDPSLVVNPYTVTPLLQTPDAGDVVWDIEGPLNVSGVNTFSTFQSKIEILSLEVSTNNLGTNGGPLFPGYPSATGDIFLARTFEQDCGIFLAYNRAAMLVNNALNLANIALVHTDENHQVCEKDDVRSEPTYVGGEAFVLNCITPRPTINFCNAQMFVYSNVAFTGVDLTVDNKVAEDQTGFVCTGNLSNFIFFSNGKRVDCGTGRQFNLGTLSGARACDGFTLVSADANLDIMQTSTCDNDTAGIRTTLILTTSVSVPEINPCIVDDITGQTSIHTVYLGNASNITIGTDVICQDFVESLTAELLISGNYFSFETRGGCASAPALGGVTGQGIIFVDRNGLFTIGSPYRASIGTMVVKRDNASVVLPKEQIYFDCFVGVTDWKLDLNCTTTLVALGECFSDYTLNWLTTVKDYDVFCPYEVSEVNLCGCPPVLQKNVMALPTVAGEVFQFQIQGSRIGDPVNLLVDCGYIREVIFQTGCNSAEASTGTFVLRHGGRIGLGNLHLNGDSLAANVTLGVNGVTIIADGEGRVDLNGNMIINNLCSILKGPNFNPETDVLRFHADDPTTLRVSKTGVLDLRSFNDPRDRVEFGGNIQIILEPGAKVILGGGTLQCTDFSGLIAEPSEKSLIVFDNITNALGPVEQTLSATTPTPFDQPHNQYAPLTGTGGVTNTDTFRVRLIGTGTIKLVDQAYFNIAIDSFVGVETMYEEILDVFPTVTCEIRETDIKILLEDGGELVIGDPDSDGGALQVGNTISREGHSIRFEVDCSGNATMFDNKSLGFVGFGVGIVSKPDVKADQTSAAPDDWLVDTLFDVDRIKIKVVSGTWRHDRIFSGNNPKASLLAIGDFGDGSPEYVLEIPNVTNVADQRTAFGTILGGGNMVIISRATGSGESQPGALAPIVGSVNNIVTGVQTGSDVVAARMRVGMFGSRVMLRDMPQTFPVLSPSVTFDYLRAKDTIFGEANALNPADVTGDPSIGKGTASFRTDEVFRQTRSSIGVGWICFDHIGRDNVFDLTDSLGGTQQDRRERAAEVGAVGIHLDITAEARSEAEEGILEFADQLG